TNDEIKNTKAYKEYCAFATGEAAPKPKASARSKRSGSDTSITPPTATTTPKPTVVITPRLTAAAKGKQTAKSLSAPSEPGGSGTGEGTSSKPRVPDVPTDESEEELSWNSSDDEGANDQVKDRDDDEGDEGDESDEGEKDVDEDKDGDERDNDEENQEAAKYDEQDDAEGGGDDEEEGESEEEDDNEEIREEGSFDPIPKTSKGSEDEADGKEDQGLNVNEEEHVEEEEEDELYRDVNTNQGRGLQATLEVEDTHVTLTLINSDGQQESSSVSSQFMTNMLNPTSDVGMEFIFVTASSSVAPFHTSTPIMTPSTIAYITTISQAPIPPTPIPSKRVIKEQVKGQVKEQVSRILPRIEQFVNAQLEAEVLTRSYHSSRTSYAVAADLSEMELKKILIEKMEGNKSIQRLDEQRNLYKALVDAYEADKIILDSYGETKPPTLDRDWNKTLPAVQRSTQTWISELAKQADSRSSFNELLDTPLDFSNFIMNRLRVDTPELLAGPTYECMKGSCTSLIELEYHLEEVYKATTDQLDWVNPEGQQMKWIQEPIDYDKHALWGVSHWGRKRQQFYGFAINRESALDVYSLRRIIAITDLKIVEWHSYKHLD
nr:hypothetical protein [Tanacetum cinerariifolium]